LQNAERLVRMGKAAVDLSLMTVASVTRGEPVKITAKTQPKYPNSWKLPFIARAVENAMIAAAPAYNLTGLVTACLWKQPTHVRPARIPMALGTNTVLSAFSSPYHDQMTQLVSRLTKGNAESCPTLFSATIEMAVLTELACNERKNAGPAILNPFTIGSARSILKTRDLKSVQIVTEQQPNVEEATKSPTATTVQGETKQGDTYIRLSLLSTPLPAAALLLLLDLLVLALVVA
jgi:hypothetical protein